MHLHEPDFQKQRKQLVDQIARKEVCGTPVQEALKAVPREAFLPVELHHAAYRDSALPLEHGQTISQPSVVALMTDALALTEQSRVLEIGAGSGYGAAILAHLTQEVYTIEQDELLAEQAREKLANTGVANVHVRHGDGRLGWPEKAPFDAISVTASCGEVPPALLEQLKRGGRLVIPLGLQNDWQELTCISRYNAGCDERILATVKFVPLV